MIADHAHCWRDMMQLEVSQREDWSRALADVRLGVPLHLMCTRIFYHSGLIVVPVLSIGSSVMVDFYQGGCLSVVTNFVWAVHA